MIGLTFLVLVALCCGTAAPFGGTDGRRVAGIYVLAIIGTHYARVLEPSWANPHVPVFLVDTALLAGLVLTALGSRRYWTIWIAGLHTLTVAAHASVWLLGSFNSRAYFVLASVWAPIKMLVLLAGVLLDWTARVGRDGGSADRGSRGDGAVVALRRARRHRCRAAARNRPRVG